MTNDDLEPGPRGNPDGADQKLNATGATYSPPFNRPEALHAGDHYAQYGMRSTTPQPRQEPEPAPTGSLEPFDEEFSIREARDHRPRTIPTGLKDEVTGTSWHAGDQVHGESAGEKSVSPREAAGIAGVKPDPARQ